MEGIRKSSLTCMYQITRDTVVLFANGLNFASFDMPV